MATIDAMQRMADALLRNVGGRSVALRMPAPAIAGDPGEQVGLAAPLFQDYVLAPVTFRRIRAGLIWAKATGSDKDGERAARYELLVSASAVDRLVGSLAFDSVVVLFREALGVMVGEALLPVDSCTAVDVFGGACAYRVLLRGELRFVI